MKTRLHRFFIFRRRKCAGGVCIVVWFGLGAAPKVLKRAKSQIIAFDFTEFLVNKPIDSGRLRAMPCITAFRCARTSESSLEMRG